METSRKFRGAQAGQLAGETTDIAASRDARREALSELSRLAAGLLTDAGHAVTPETMRRISTTLEGVSAYESVESASNLGRLTRDIDPPGFDAIAALMPAHLSVL